MRGQRSEARGHYCLEVLVDFATEARQRRHRKELAGHSCAMAAGGGQEGGGPNLGMGQSGFDRKLGYLQLKYQG